MLDIRGVPDRTAALGNHLIQQAMEHNYRVGYFGAARFPKTVVSLRYPELSNDLVGTVRRRFVEMHIMKQTEAKQWIRSVGENDSNRQEVLDAWSRSDSKVRILFVSPLEDLETIVPDVETVIVMSGEGGPKEMGPRWQRMAADGRTAGNVHAALV